MRTWENMVAMVYRATLTTRGFVEHDANPGRHRRDRGHLSANALNLDDELVEYFDAGRTAAVPSSPHRSGRRSMMSVSGTR